ncbi:MAG: NAD-dependent epimerase/dehydratase family protein, partial [Acidimicrobiales bacterium]
MEIVVTGSSGLIGTALVAGLEADGHRVRRLVRRPARGSDEVRWDPSAGEIDRDGLEGVDGVVHLAGPGIGDKRWSEARKHDLREARVVGTALLAETLAGLDAKPPVLVSGSAIGYYGDRGDEKLTEKSKAGNDFLADLCRDWEGAAAPAAAAGIRVATIRTGIVLAPGGGALEKLLPLFKLGLGGRLG